jgi:CTP-dependent riboflavin kinase
MAPIVIQGRVQSGTKQAAHWLSLFNAAYATKLGVPIFPGSLNVGLDTPFDWFDPRWEDAVVHFPGAEYGGERDILLLPCSLSVASGLPAFLWSTTTAARDPADRLVAEVIASVQLRSIYGLKDGDPIAIELQVGARSDDAG